MGMYTAVVLNVDFKPEMPREIAHTLYERDYEVFKSLGFGAMVGSGSYYHPGPGGVWVVEYDSIHQGYRMTISTDIKNYDGEIDKFVDYISPWVEDEFLGYARYEEGEPYFIYRSPEKENM